MTPLGKRARQTRYGVHGEVLATFWPKSFTPASCRQGMLFLRKWRGNRWQTWFARRRRGLV